MLWNPSTDNVGVAGYYVYRTDAGAAPIASVTTTTYGDGSVNATTVYSYYVEAFDEAGNVSDPSTTVTVTTPARKGGKRTNAFAPTGGSGIVSLSPNPFNPTTVLTYTVDQPSDVTIEIVNSEGRILRTLRPGTRGTGEYRERIDATEFASGIYFIRMTAVPVEAPQDVSLTATKAILLK